MDEIKEKYLPVGTVVLLKNGKKRVMITGFCVTPQGKDEAYDYSGCLYPEGFLSSNQNCLFNHSQIEKVFHMGLIDDEEINFKKQLKSLIDMADQFSKFKITDNDIKQDNNQEEATNVDNEVQEENMVLTNDSDGADTDDNNVVSEETIDNIVLDDNNIDTLETVDNMVLDDNTDSFPTPFNVENNEEVEIAQEPNDKVEIETLDDFIG